jgi:CubicO group peptidase (beta-lactamase class C family)
VTPTRPDNPAQARVQEIIDADTASGAETGVQVAAYLDGELVVDAWAGLADVGTGTPMGPDTLVPSWSTGKGVAASLVAVLVDRGVLDYAAPVAEYWPEYGANGKHQTTLGHVMSHSAGVPHLREDITPEELFDLPALAAWIAGQAPLWEPGTSTGYHGWTWGVLVAEIVRRVSGAGIDEVFRREVGEPLGIANCVMFAVPDRLRPNLATCYDGGWAAMLDGFPADSSFFTFAPRAVLPVAELANRDDFRRTPLPANGTMSARGAARLYGALARGGEIDGVRLLSAATLNRATDVRTVETDRMLGFPLAKGYGYMLGGTGSVVRAADGGFGTNGSGGSAANADPVRRLSFALTKNRMSANKLDTRLLAEIRAALGL